LKLQSKSTNAVVAVFQSWTSVPGQGCSGELIRANLTWSQPALSCSTRPVLLDFITLPRENQSMPCTSLVVSIRFPVSFDWACVALIELVEFTTLPSCSISVQRCFHSYRKSL
jgi:hypothetical protein